MSGFMFSRRRWVAQAFSVGAVSWASAAWSATPALPAFVLRGPTLRGDRFDLARQRGRVVMVVYWSTDCAVCRDKLPELRQNLAGWSDKPFDLVMVSLDRREDDWPGTRLCRPSRKPRRCSAASLYGLGRRGSKTAWPLGHLSCH